MRNVEVPSRSQKERRNRREGGSRSSMMEKENEGSSDSSDLDPLSFASLILVSLSISATNQTWQL